MKPSSRSSGRQLPASFSPVKKEEPEIKKESSPSSSLVPYPGHSPIPTGNRFTTIDNIRPNYQSALVTQYDPYRSDSQPSSQSPVNYRKTSPYAPRMCFNLFYIEPDLSHLKFPQTLARAYFPLVFISNQIILLSHSNSTLKFFTKQVQSPSKQSQIKEISQKFFTIPFISLKSLVKLNGKTLHSLDTAREISPSPIMTTKKPGQKSFSTKLKI